MHALRGRAWTVPFAVAALIATAAAQTRIEPPPDSYKPADDVKLGLQAAQQVRQQLPMMRDEEVNGYLTAIGDRLVRAVPEQFQHPEFHYTFTGVNVSDINAFALPGGPMFINRGMIEKAHDEGEIAGVMAHELSHVVLRHGTAQATKAKPYAIGEIAGAILGAIVGGNTGALISQGTQFGVGTYFLKYSREYERQADLLGTHIMARAGYDPRDLANVFRLIEQQGGPGGPQWMSDHPDPGNRYEYINQEAALLRVAPHPSNTDAFRNVQAHLRALPLAPTTEQYEKSGGAARTPSSGPTVRPDPSRVSPPASRFTTYDEGSLFRVSVPDNWKERGGNNSVTFAPDGGYGTIKGQSVFTHGVEIGVSQNETHDLATATQELIQTLQQGNPQLRAEGREDRTSVAGRDGLHTVLSNVSEATGREERIDVTTAILSNGDLFYVLGVAPSEQFDRYAPVFRRIVDSIQLNS
jgi:Zn-dependent protease with chaperone function